MLNFLSSFTGGGRYGRRFGRYGARRAGRGNIGRMIMLAGVATPFVRRYLNRRRSTHNIGTESGIADLSTGTPSTSTDVSSPSSGVGDISSNQIASRQDEAA